MSSSTSVKLKGSMLSSTHIQHAKHVGDAKTFPVCVDCQPDQHSLHFELSASQSKQGVDQACLHR